MQREGLSLRKIIDDNILFKGFEDFCRVQHAYENLEFWLAVEFLHDNYRDDSSSPPASVSSPRKSGRKTFFEKLSLKGKSLEELPVRINKIYNDFLVSNAPKWVCIDPSEFEEITKKIDSGIFDCHVFDAAQKKVYTNMEKDLVPRFERSFDNEESVFEAQAAVRGSVRYIPDSKLRQSLVNTITQ